MWIAWWPTDTGGEDRFFGPFATKRECEDFCVLQYLKTGNSMYEEGEKVSRKMLVDYIYHGDPCFVPCVPMPLRKPLN